VKCISNRVKLLLLHKSTELHSTFQKKNWRNQSRKANNWFLIILHFFNLFSWNDFSSFQDIYFHSKQKRNEQVTLFNPMYISFFQNLVHTFFSFNCFFSNIFFVFFILGYDHIYFYKNMTKFFPNDQIWKRYLPNEKKTTFFFTKYAVWIMT